MKINIGFLPTCWVLGIDYDPVNRMLFIYFLPMLPIMVDFGSRDLMNVYQVDDYSGDWYYICAYSEQNAIDCFEDETGELFDGECKITLMNPRLMAGIKVIDQISQLEIPLSSMLDGLRQPCILASSVE